uniref:Uncharacterized protein n=1 Tax=Octopus bimaculoides TaxID=37653 RepID=A0A0L8G578_OCTBM
MFDLEVLQDHIPTARPLFSPTRYFRHKTLPVPSISMRFRYVFTLVRFHAILCL